MVCSENSRKLTASRKQSRTMSAQVRSLDDLPMKWNKSDSVRVAGKCRETMSAKSAASTQAHRVSHCMFTESRRLFDDAFRRAKASHTYDAESARLPPVSSQRSTRSSCAPRDEPLISIRDTMPSSCSVRSTRSIFQHTGPTPYGSPIYNSVSQPVLDRIHAKPLLAEPPPEYFRATPDIEKCLKESNSLFRVRRPSSKNDSSSEDQYSARSNDSFSKFILVPNRHGNSRSASLSKNGLTPVSQLLKEDHMQDSDTFSHNLPDIHVEECDNLDVHAPGKTLDTQSRPDLLHKDQVKLSTGNRGHFSASSNKGLMGNQKVAGLGATQNAKSSVRSQQSVRLQPAMKKEEQNHKKSKKKKKAKDDSQDESASTDPVFPDFICPSSETKSQEAYVRQWIRQNTFTKCNRSVPLE